MATLKNSARRLKLGGLGSTTPPTFGEKLVNFGQQTKKLYALMYNPNGLCSVDYISALVAFNDFHLVAVQRSHHWTFYIFYLCRQTSSGTVTPSNFYPLYRLTKAC